MLRDVCGVISNQRMPFCLALWPSYVQTHPPHVVHNLLDEEGVGPLELWHIPHGMLHG